MLGKASWDIPLDFYPGSFGNPDNLDFYRQFDLDDIQTSDEVVTRALRDITRRAVGCGRETTLGLFDPDQPMVVIEFPAGTASRHVWVDPASAVHFASQPFEDYELLERYVGVWSATHALVEVIVDFADPLVLMAHMDRKGLQRAPIAEAESAQGDMLRIGAPSPVGRALLPGSLSSVPRVTLRLEGPTAPTEAEASSKFEAVGNAFLFQFDLVHEGLPRLRKLADDRRQHWMKALRYDRRRVRPITYPVHALRTEPLRLYHYGRTLSDEFPLLQFLSYYHVLEFFFPAYSRLDVVRRLQEAIRDPAFEVESTREIDRLLDLIPNRTTRGLGSEREQLRATIRHCMDPEKLRQFIHTHRNEDTGLALADYLADASRLPGTTPVPRDARDDLLLQHLVERIYKLRSRIVHAKDPATSGDLEESISPFSPEADELHPEVEVLRFLAEAVLESSSAPL